MELSVDAPVERCFDLSVDVNVHIASVAATRERAIAGVVSGRMGLGDEVTWEARHLFKTRRLTSRITEWDRPRCFVDEMVTGPFKSFRHEHLFENAGLGTNMIDVFHFESPFGWVGRVGDVLILERYLRRLLETRNRYIKRIAESDSEDSPLH